MNNTAVQKAQEVYSAGTELRDNIERFAGKRLEGNTYDFLKSIDRSLTDDKLDSRNRELVRQRMETLERKLQELKQALTANNMI